MGGPWLKQLFSVCLLCCVWGLTAASNPSSSYSCNANRPGLSQHSCFGESASVRSCRFRNLYYDTTGNGTWVYFEAPGDPPEVKAGGRSSVSFDFQSPPNPSRGPDQYFYSEHFVSSLISLKDAQDAREPFALNVTVSRSAPPAPEDVTMRPGVSLLWGFFGNSHHSYGHCILNDWLPMVIVLHSHFDDPLPPFHILMHGPVTPLVCLHYVAPFSRGPPPVNFTSAVANATATGRRWIRFCDLVAGDAGYQHSTVALFRNSDKIPLVPPAVMNAGNWRIFRRAVYHAHGIQPARRFDVHQDSTTPHRPHITVLHKNEDPTTVFIMPHRRRILNAPELVKHLTRAFPDVTSSLVDFVTLNPTEQLQVMARTSVFITTQGSAGFRQVFLNRGARVILIGTPVRNRTKEGFFGRTSFFEVPAYFQVADYRITKYPILPDAPEFVSDESPKEPNYEDILYDMDVTVNLTRMTGFVYAALLEVERGNEWLSDVEPS